MKNNKIAIHSWALYDFANTIFSMNIVSMYFSLWIIKDLKASDLTYSIALSISMLMVAIFSPIMGVISDVYKKRMPYIIYFTLGSCLCTGLISLTLNIYLSLILFIIANFCYQIALVFYNALLPQLSTPDNIGKISGYGTAVGYIGSIVGVAMVMPFVSGKILVWDVPIEPAGNIGAFVPTAILFLIFSLPIFLFVKDKQSPDQMSSAIKYQPFKKIWDSIVNTKKYPGVLTFLIANFFFLDAINTVISFMSVYSVKVVGFNEKTNEVQIMLMIATVGAIIGSFLWGVINDLIGSKKALIYTLLLWIITLIGVIIINNKESFYFISILAGISLGGVWTTSRPMMTELTPKEMYGEFFGLYSLSGKFSAIFGPMTWGLVIHIFKDYEILKYQFAVFSQLFFLILGLTLLFKIKE